MTSGILVENKRPQQSDVDVTPAYAPYPCRSPIVVLPTERGVQKNRVSSLEVVLRQVSPAAKSLRYSVSYSDVSFHCFRNPILQLPRFGVGLRPYPRRQVVTMAETLPHLTTQASRTVRTSIEPLLGPRNAPAHPIVCAKTPGHPGHAEKSCASSRMRRCHDSLCTPRERGPAIQRCAVATERLERTKPMQ
jgi:hypothetical protein